MCSNSTVEMPDAGWREGERSTAVDASAHQSILVIGLGNPILGDDGAGWRAAELVQAGMYPEQARFVDVSCLGVGGLRLMEALAGSQRAILLDAIHTGTSPVGTLTVTPLEQLPEHTRGHLTSAHDTSLQQALQVGRSMGVALPAQIMIIGIETPFVYDFSEQLSPAVAACVPEAVCKALQLIHQWVPSIGSEPFACTHGG